MALFPATQCLNGFIRSGLAKRAKESIESWVQDLGSSDLLSPAALARIAIETADARDNLERRRS